MTAVELLNLALLKIGVSQGITALDQQTQEAWTGELLYDHHLRATLRSFPWGFATKYLELTLVRGPVWDDDTALVQAWSAAATYAIGDVVVSASVIYYAIAANTNQLPPNANWSTTEAPEHANGDWLYGYRWPTDCLFGRRLVPASGIGRKYDATPLPFRVGRDVNGLLFYANEPAAVLEYTMLDCDNLWADDLWIDAFTWRVAAALAPSLSKIKDMHTIAWRMYLHTLDLASGVSSREQQQEKPGEAEWITARG